MYDWKPIIRLAQAHYGECGDGLFCTANFQNAFCDEFGCELSAIPPVASQRILKDLPFVERAGGRCYWRAVRS